MPYYDFLFDCPVNCAMIYAVRCIVRFYATNTLETKPGGS